MPQDNPKGSNSNGDSADQPPSEKHQIAAAIQSLERQYRAAQEGHIQHEQQTFIWTRRAGVGVLAYTVLTVVIMCASIYSARQAAISADAARDSLSITRENFKADQRPIVWLTNNLGNPTWIQNKIVWSYHFTNYGKSPAANVRFDVNMSIDGSPFQDFGPIEKWRGTGAPVVPTKDDFETAVSDTEISQAEFIRLRTIDNGISISGVIAYHDAVGDQYETAFCLSQLASGAILYRKPSENCRNEIK